MNTTSRNYTPKLDIFLCILLAMITGCVSRSSTLAPSGTSEQISTVNDYWPTQGWRISSPEAQGFDSKTLEHLLDVIQQVQKGIESLLIIRHGYIVSENYFNEYNQDMPHELFSCTKSFISTLVGIAIDKGFIKSVNQPVLEFFPEQTSVNPDPLRTAMTVENLLTMTSGLTWIDGDPAYEPGYSTEVDWASFVLKKPMAEQPGTRFNYCTGCSHVLSVIVQRASGMNTMDFANQYLFKPLGIKSPDWIRDPMEIPVGGWGLYLTPRDMAKLGYLYLQQGRWDGQQIVSTEWVKAATRKSIDTGIDSGVGYGYQWWTYPKYGAFMAQGRFGQIIFVLPDQDLIVVSTANDGILEVIYEMIETYILPAIKG